MHMIKKMEELTAKAEKRDVSIASKQSSSSKFLKRKPDVKKIMSGVGGKKRKQNQISQYFGSEIFTDRRNNIASLENSKSDSCKYISISNQVKGNSTKVKMEHEKMLLKVKSQKNIKLIYKQLDASSMEEGDHGLNISEIEVSNYKKSRADEFTPIQPDFKGYISFQQRANLKKSKTEFFIQEQTCQKEDTIKTEDRYEVSLSGNQNNEEENSQEINMLKGDYTSLVKKNRILQEQLDAYLEREYLLKTKQKHLEDIIREKDKIIDKLYKQKVLWNMQEQGGIQSQMQKLKKILQDTKNELDKQLKRQENLKQENNFLQKELMIKNQQLILVYDKYSELQYNCSQERKKTKKRIQCMKLQIENVRAQAKEQLQQIESYGQMQKWKQKIFQQQQELKYLRIQNQCLLISKEQLHKSENENRKLKEQRDYFKRKVLDQVKRSKTKLSQISSSGSSALLELSQISIDQ